MSTARAAGVHFITGPPIAGTEHSGPEAGFSDLFETMVYSDAAAQ